VVTGCVLAATGLALWASQVTQLSLSHQWYFILLPGSGMGLMVGPSNTDAINQVGRLSYGEATGVTQTTRNFGASFGLAAPGHAAGDRAAHSPDNAPAGSGPAVGRGA